mgnify:FL=1
MKSIHPNIIVIVGPTASGKSALAVRLAKKFHGEVISADSRQVYRGLDIGTGKITRRQMQGVRHHLIDVAEPKRQFSVAEFQELAHRTIRDIATRGKIPFLAGGTAFWVDAVACGLRLPAAPPKEALRKLLARKSAEELFQILIRLDPARARTIERQNPRRLIRAIEIARALGRVPALEKRSPYRALWLGISASPEIQKRRIHERLLKRIRAGMIAEAKKLHDNGLGWRRFHELGLEYRYLAEYLRGKLTKQEMTRELEKAIWRFARHQMSWWRRNKNILWLRQPTDADRAIRAFISTKTRRARGAR